MNWFVLPSGPSCAVEFNLAGGLTCIAMLAACVPGLAAIRAALRRRAAIRAAPAAALEGAQPRRFRRAA
jgi:hypothetical protein